MPALLLIGLLCSGLTPASAAGAPGTPGGPSTSGAPDSVSGNGFDADDPVAWRPRQRELAAMGDGALVWASRRTDRWRIFTMDLDGTGLRQLSPDEEARDHFSPHISPDGRRVVFLSYARGDHGYTRNPTGNRARLEMIDLDGSNRTTIAPAARAYFEHRAAVWIDEHTLIYIDGDGFTRKLDVDTGESTALTAEGRETFGYLLSPDLRHATTGQPDFARYDPDTQRITPRQQHPGCQPYFTRDGRWGFWVAGAGGPISAIRLDTGEIKTILDRGDPRLPADRGYLYFPMISADQRLLAFAASPNEHDHFRADYDIFVAPLDPQTLQVVDRPVRYTFDDATDRYPDVFMTPLPLGSHRGKAPHTVELEAPGDNAWHWDFGDGTTGRGRRVEHTYRTPGQYRITARAGASDDATVLRGSAIVRPATRPQVRSVLLRDERRIRVWFSEPVRWAGQPGATLASGAAIASLELAEDGRRLDITLAQPPDAPPDAPWGEADRLELAPLIDHAQQPNALADEPLAISRGSWPAEDDRLVFLWKTSDSANLVPDPDGDGDARRSFAAEMRGRATLDHHWRMRLTGGWFHFEDAGAAIAAAVRRHGALSVEATLIPLRADQRGPARILTLAEDGDDLIALVQDGRHLVLYLRSAPGAGAERFELFPLVPGRANHVVVTASPDGVIGYHDGRRRYEVETEAETEAGAVDVDLPNWTGGALTVGAAADGAEPWHGTIEGVAIYAKALTAGAVRHSHLAQRQIAAARDEPPRLVVEATVRAVSQRPTLDRVQPYRRALMLYEYEVDRVLEGTERSPRLRVAHWGLLDGEPVSAPEKGQRVRLELLPLDATPQALTEYLHSTLEPDFELPEYYALPR